jgi:transposase-like protein
VSPGQEIGMGFEPPRCPNQRCEQHTRPTPQFYRRCGFYWPRCRPEGVPRFRCRSCKRGFSRQTFRHDWRDRRPECNEPLFKLLTSGVGLRQSGRYLDLDIHSVQDKQRKMARTCHLLHDNLSHVLPAERTYLLDEEETYETASIRPVTMPVLIEKETWFVVSTAVGSIRRLAPVGGARRHWQERDERRHGIRRDMSSLCVRLVLQELARRVDGGRIVLRTDQKATYGSIARAVFGEQVVHETTAGTRVRNTHNPLFPINTTLAMTRDNCGRLRRRSWLVTKRREYLQAHLAIFVVYRNYVRRRFNRDGEGETPARFLRLLPRQMHPPEVLAWRQDWGALSIHPMSHAAATTVAQAFPPGGLTA